MKELRVTEVSTNGDKQEAYTEACKEPYKVALKLLEEHGLECFVAKLQRKHSLAIINIGFGKYFVGAKMSKAQLQDRVREWMSKPNHKQAKFWKDANPIIAASTNQNANQMTSANQQNMQQGIVQQPQQASHRSTNAVVPSLPNTNPTVPQPSRQVVVNPYKKAPQQKRQSNPIISRQTVQNQQQVPALQNVNQSVPPQQFAANQPQRNPYLSSQQQAQLYAFQQLMPTHP
eukprot:scaffold41637_cov82-Cyclotella_meneghiniana.AAC.7